MSALYVLNDSIIGKAIGAVCSAALNPFLTAPLLAFLEKSPQATIDNLLQNANLPAGYDLTLAKGILTALAAVGAVRFTNKKLSTMAANSWRLSPAPGWDWPSEIAVVTGGCSGIGLCIVKELLEKGIRVAVFDIQPLPKELTSKATVRYYKCDVTSKESIAAAAAGVREDFGEPTILYNNAGIAVPNRILDISEGALQRIFAINTMAHWFMVQQFMPYMVEKNHGHIITVASVASFACLPGHADYGSTKASALAFHEALRSELRHIYKAPNVLTSIVHPNFVATPLLTDMKSHLTQAGVRFLTPERVAKESVAPVFARQGAQVIIPASSSIASALRGWPTWMQTIIHDAIGRDAGRLKGSTK